MIDPALFLVAFWGLIFVLCVVEQLLGRTEDISRAPARWPANFGLVILAGLLTSLVPLGSVGAAAYAAEHGLGLLNAASIPYLGAAALTIVLRSFTQYAFHRLAHAVPLLWRLHRVHHSDRHLDCTTGLRNHPVESVVVTLAYIPLVTALGLDPLALAFYEGIEALINIATHTSSSVPQKLDRVLSGVFITPKIHRIHHSDYQPETDSNFGAVFTIWDRLLGTYCPHPASREQPFSVGLAEIDAGRAEHLPWLLWSPAKDLRPQNAD